MTHSSSDQQRQHARVADASSLTMWRKSSYSGGESGDCLEVNDCPCAAHVPVRDSKNPHGPAVVFTSGAWTAFLGAVKAADRPRR
ncbi:DUF397 domain-containing protein [Streptomyces sp. NBC_01446]|uniref:DUF397 domain-containing protein n=1 Tax=Streptomyces sp. NBC_00119 TaxID=2975659 RepID=A0AAU1U7B0_9ACTN|nr:DUF397 domain-containing protein [Streptomyces sp. NBC_01446]MCX4643603.1 DUF397 domain-containing protein [Streptomyces sp. NBC_01446]